MSAYYDTGVILPLYVKESFSDRILSFANNRRQSIPFNVFQQLELETAFRLKRFRGEIDEAQLCAVITNRDEDLQNGRLVFRAVDWVNAMEDARRIGAMVTVKAGCRTLDLLHVAIAVQWKSAIFVTADDRQIKAARAAGLQTVDVRTLPGMTDPAARHPPHRPAWYGKNVPVTERESSVTTMHDLRLCVLASTFLIAAFIPRALTAGETATENVSTVAAAFAAVWDDVATQLPNRAVAQNLPPPSLTDLTLPKAMAGSNLRMQLVTWSNRYVFGRAWVEGLDDLPRPVWVLDEKPAQNGVKLTLTISLPEVSQASFPKEVPCPFDVTLRVDADKVSGDYATPGVNMELLPVASAKGALQGTQTPLSGGIGQKPRLLAPKVTGTAQDLTDARRYLLGASLLMRQFRSIDISLTQPVDPTTAWSAGRCMIPEFQEGRADGKLKSEPAKGTKSTSADDLLDSEMGAGGGLGAPPAGSTKPEARAPAGPETKTKLLAILGLLERMRVSAAAWAASLPSARAAPPGAAESAEDPDFGPWFGHGSLATNATQANVLPDDVTANSSPRWLFVRNWQCIGPFPSNQAEVLSWNLSEFLGDAGAHYVTDLDALKHDEEPSLPETPLLSWQPVQDQIEEGLQRPWTQREPGGHGSVLKYAGPQNACSYARTDIYSPKDVDLWVGIGADDFGRVWVNDRLAAATMGASGTAPNVSANSERIAWGKASFRKGVNTIVVRCDNTAKRSGNRVDPRSLESFFWVKVAVSGKPLDAAAAKARQAAMAGRRADMRHVPPGVVAYRNNNTAYYPDAKPVTAWDLKTGRNVIWRAHLEMESPGGYGGRANSGKAPPVIMGDRIILLCEPHFVFCLDKAKGETLWERECNVLEFTAPDKVEESRRLWAEYAKARGELMRLGHDYEEREATLTKRGMSSEEAKAEIRRLSGEEGSKGWQKGSGAFGAFLSKHGKFAGSAYGGWTGYCFGAPVTDGERVWVKFGTGVAACFDRDGKRIWMSQIPAEGDYTVCPSPLLVGGRLVVEVGARSERPGQERFGWDFTRLIGLDAATGKELWRTEPLFHPSATSSSVAMNLTNGREEMDVIVTDGAAVVRAEDGKIMSQTWLMDAGAGTPTVGGAEVYHSSDRLTSSRPVMYDRNSAGLRRLWISPMPCEFDAGLAFSDGILYGSGGGQGASGYVVFDTVRIKLLRHEPPSPGSSVWRGVPPQTNGRQYVPITVGGNYVFISEHGSAFHGRVAKGPVWGVMQKKWDGLLVGQSLAERSCTAPPVFEGDRTYIRSDPSLVCLGHTGDEGRAYEADVNARYMLGDLEAQPPEDAAPIAINPRVPGRPTLDAGFAGFISYPINVYGYFDAARADEVLTALGGTNGIGTEKGELKPVEIAGEQIVKKHRDNCGMYGHTAIGENTHFRDVAFGKGAYFSATLVNDRERVVRVWAPQEPPDVWICGQRVPEGTRLKLKPGTYSILARAFNTEQWPAAQGFYFRFDDSSDVKAERERWQNLLKASRPELERIAKYGTRPAQVERAKKLLAAIVK